MRFREGSIAGFDTKLSNVSIVETHERHSIRMELHADVEDFDEGLMGKNGSAPLILDVALRDGADIHGRPIPYARCPRCVLQRFSSSGGGTRATLTMHVFAGPNREDAPIEVAPSLLH